MNGGRAVNLSLSLLGKHIDENSGDITERKGKGSWGCKGQSKKVQDPEVSNPGTEDLESH